MLRTRRWLLTSLGSAALFAATATGQDFPAAYVKVADPQWRSFSFRDRENYLKDYAKRRRQNVEAVLERYYLVKINSLQFCGPANFGLPFWRGLESLALTLPAILWLIRAFRDLPREAAAIQALSIVDHNFAYSPHLGSRWQRFSLGLLAQRGELEKLIGWYSR